MSSPPKANLKFHRLGDQLVALIAGRPGRAKELAMLYRSHLKQVRLSEDNLLDTLMLPIGRVKRRLAEEYIQRCLAISYQELLDNGERWFGKERTERYQNNIASNKLGVEMIFAGFIGKEPILCQLSEGGIDVVTNFCLIGTGAYTAEPALHARGQLNTTPLSQAMYNVYEAKKLGESSPFVGQSTAMLVLHAPEDESRKLRTEYLTGSGRKFIGKLFKKHGPKPMRMCPDLPEDALQCGTFF